MVLSKYRKMQIESQQNELVSELQKDAQALFYDRMMYDINDSLTSILAVCDIEAKEAVPKIKDYIHRINKSLQSTKSYQNSSLDEKFNINLVLRNLMRVIDENYVLPKKAALLSEIKAPVQGNQAQFEQLFLHVFINLFPEGRSSEADVLIELRQKDQDVMVTIIRDGYAFSEDSLERITKKSEAVGLKENIKIKSQDDGVEISIKMPLLFESISLGESLLISNRKIRSPQKGYETAPYKSVG